MDTNGLSPEQQAALTRLQEVTDGIDETAAVNVLRSVGWDVQRAAELLFEPADTSATGTRQPFEVDDSQQHAGGTNNSWSHQPRTQSLLAPLMSILAYPFHLVTNLFRLILNVLRIPFPQLGLFSIRLLRPGGSANRRVDRPERWIRELEEETGALCLSNARSREAHSSGVEPGTGSSISQRPTGTYEEPKYLPDFEATAYEAFLKRCNDDIRIGCIILVSDEHDDTAEFKRATLTDRRFVDALSSNNILVWGGDVRSREAYSASEKLQATTYPFVAFIALQAKRSVQTQNSVNSTPALTVLSRHQGYSSTGSPTSASSLIDHIERQLLPRVTPYLERLILARRERERDRMLRDEQDRAFQQSKDRDRERIEAKMSAERLAREAKEQEERMARIEQERRERGEAERAARKSDRLHRRRWLRRSVRLVDSPGKDAVRIALSLPGSGRIIHHFHPDSTMTDLFSFVDIHLIPAECTPEDDPTSASADFPKNDQELEQLVSQGSPADDWFGYRLLSAYPRAEIHWKPNCKIQDLDILKQGGHLIVESQDNVNREDDADLSD